MHAFGMLMYGVMFFIHIHYPIYIVEKLIVNDQIQEQEHDLDQKAMSDALMLINQIMLIHENAPLEKWPKSMRVKNGMRSVCQVTQPQVEDMLRTHALTYEGGVTAEHMKRVADRMSKAIGFYADATGNDDGKVYRGELEDFLRSNRVIKNNGMFFLLCFIEVYK